MKQILLFVTIIIFHFNAIAQSQKDSLNKVVRERIKDIRETESDNPYYTKEETENNYISDNNTFQSLAQPSENSDLAQFFKMHLESKLLKEIDFTAIKDSYLLKNISNSKYNYTIRLTFEISKDKKATNCRIYTGNRKLDKKVIEVFKKYPLEKLGLKESDKLGKISVQLFAKENKNIIIKASTVPVVDQFPTVKGCENLELNWQLNKCFYDKLFEHIVQNISLKNINKQDLRGDVIFKPRFSVNADGKIYNVNSIAPNETIKDEIDRAILSFDQVLIPGKRNGEPKNTYCETFRSLTIENIK